MAFFLRGRGRGHGAPPPVVVVEAPSRHHHQHHPAPVVVVAPAPVVVVAPSFLSRHELRHGNRISILAHHGHPLYAESDGRLHSTWRDVHYGAVWTVEHHGHYVAFRSVHGHYLCDDNGNFVANRTAVGDWEKFEIEDCGRFRGRVALRSKPGRYLCSPHAGGGCEYRSVAAEWEHFTLVDHGPSFVAPHYVAPAPVVIVAPAPRPVVVMEPSPVVHHHHPAPAPVVIVSPAPHHHHHHHAPAPAPVVVVAPAPRHHQPGPTVVVVPPPHGHGHHHGHGRR